ncbi:MAG TPA: hypothetical protein VFB45_10585 [Pseudolabrys sp.]|nr:hypothetical protein [Pseudolabrys sp.]
MPLERQAGYLDSGRLAEIRDTIEAVAESHRNMMATTEQTRLAIEDSRKLLQQVDVVLAGTRLLLPVHSSDEGLRSRTLRLP